MNTIKSSLLETVGKTPLVRINQLNKGKAEIFAKVEYFNPAGSVKDRIAIAMVEDAEKSGKLKPGATIVEPTSGNTGIGLALVAAVKGYRLILTMPETMSIERRNLLKAYGAELRLTPGPSGMKGAIEEAENILRSDPTAFMPQQFDNPANPACHKRTTAVEIWSDTSGKIDVFVAGVGTGGTLSGVGEFLKEKNPKIRIIAVEPAESPVLSGGNPGPHRIQGIGAGFIPKNVNLSIIDEIIPVRSEDAGITARAAAVHEGLLVGVSSGAALFAALELSVLPRYENQRIVVLFPDSGERYLSAWPFAS